MPNRFESLCRVLCLVVVPAATGAAGAANPATVPRVGPSDCRPRDADSTCATAVVAAAIPNPPANKPATVMYSGPLGGVPANGYAYWGYDFIAEETGSTSPVRQDQFINRSSVAVTIRLSFNFPINRPCSKACLPGVQFQVDAGWYKLDPPFTIDGNTATVTETFEPGRGYGWVIGLWQATNPRLTVSVPAGTTATLRDVGLSPFPAVATEIPAITRTCGCSDGTIAACSDGTRFSNGLLGQWTQNFTNYIRTDAFNNCPLEH